MTKDLEKIIGDSEYIILKNGEVIEGSTRSLSIDKDIALKLIHIIDNDTNMKLVIEEGKNVHLEEIFYDVKNDVTINSEIHCKKNASLEILSFRKCLENSNISVNANTYLYENAYIESKNITSFSSDVLFNQNIYLVEKGSKMESFDVVIGSCGNNQKFDFDTYHQVGDTYSNMKNFCISKNDSVIFMNTNGKIIKGASKSELSQKTKGLILDEFSQISANPLLLIDEYDCLAGHGASIGAIDEEELYYLMSRGLTREDSERLIVEGFVYPFIEGLKDEKVRSYCLGYIKNFL